MEGPYRRTFLSETRAAFRRSLRSQGVEESDVEEMVICLNEACTNAILHARPSEGIKPSLDVSWDVSAGVATIRVRDFGEGFRPQLQYFIHPPEYRERGRGLFLMSRLSDGLLINSGASGSEIVFRKALSGASLSDPPS